MKTRHISMILAAVILVAFVQQAPAQNLKAKSAILLGTTGACNSENPGGDCITPSFLVELDPKTGALIREIGLVGYTVNGLAWDSGTLYATTSAGDPRFHGLITIDPQSGGGFPVDGTLINFGLEGERSPIHSITIDIYGNLVGWYDEFPAPDSYVHIDKLTGVAVEFDSGINTSRNGVSFDELNFLWNIDSPRFQGDDTFLTQTAYILNPFNGEAFDSILLDPPTAAAIGDFNPVNNLYYGLDFDTAEPSPGRAAFIVEIDPRKGKVKTLGQTVDDLHTLTFVKGE